jgi:hypothetical protein
MNCPEDKPSGYHLVYLQEKCDACRGEIGDEHGESDGVWSRVLAVEKCR